MARDCNASPPGWMTRALMAWVRMVATYPRVVLCLIGASLILAIGGSVAYLQYKTQRNDLLAADHECQIRWQRYLDAFGDDDDLIVVIRGSDPACLRPAADRVAELLQGQPERFDRIFHRVDLRALHARSLLFLPYEEIAAIDRRLDGMAPLFGPLAPVSWRALTTQALLTQASVVLEARSRGRELTLPERDLLAQLPALLNTAASTLDDPTTYRNPWSLNRYDDTESERMLAEPQYFTAAEGRMVLVLARPRKAQDSFTPAQEAAKAARELLAIAQQEYPTLEFGLTGLPILETDEMAASDEDSKKASGLAMAGVALLYLIVYRGLRYPFLTISTLIAGTIWALGWATLTVGHLNILSATFAVMIIGMGDYGVLWVARYDEARKLGRDLHEALQDTAQTVGPSIMTAAGTTTLAFLATMLTDFRAVAELGWIAGSGVLFCAVACITMLPALIVLLETYRRPQQGMPAILPFPGTVRPFMPVFSRFPKLIVAASVVVLVGGALTAFGIRYDANLLNMQARGLDSVYWEHELIQHTAGATWDAMSLAHDRQEAMELRRRYEALPGVGRVIEAASLIPEDQERKLPLLASIQQKLARMPEVIPQPYPTLPEDLLKLTSRALAHAGTEPAISLGLARFQQALERHPKPMMAMSHYDQNMAADLARELRSLARVCEPRGITIEDLPPAFRERYIGAQGEYLVRAFATENLWEYDSLQTFTETVVQADPQATGKVFRTLEGLRQMRSGFERAGLCALAVIMVVLWCDFRRVSSLLYGLFPLAFGIAATLGFMVLWGIPLNPANLIALPLIVGVGIDNGIHVLHDYRNRQRGKLYSLSAPTGRGIAVASLTTILGFGTMGLARHQGMASLGLTLTLGVSMCTLAALVVVPALLRIADARALRKAPRSEPVPTRIVRRAA